VAQFLAWSRGLEVQPTVVGLRAKVRAVIIAELERTIGKLRHLEGDRGALMQMAESAVNKLLHMPTTRLRQRASNGDDADDLAAAVRFLFDLQEISGTQAADGGDARRSSDPSDRKGAQESSRSAEDDDERLTH
jgi:glutamyl-tRNA reductase